MSHIPGRFAIDFIQLGADGKMTAGDKNIVTNWHGYGADVLAVSDGVVADPHLHLHVADCNSPLGAEGLPFVFENFSLLGSYPEGEGLGERRWSGTKAGGISITQERPGPNAVISFR